MADEPAPVEPSKEAPKEPDKGFHLGPFKGRPIEWIGLAVGVLVLIIGFLAYKNRGNAQQPDQGGGNSQRPFGGTATNSQDSSGLVGMFSQQNQSILDALRSLAKSDPSGTSATPTLASALNNPVPVIASGSGGGFGVVGTPVGEDPVIHPWAWLKTRDTQIADPQVGIQAGHQDVPITAAPHSGSFINDGVRLHYHHDVPVPRAIIRPQLPSPWGGHDQSIRRTFPWVRRSFIGRIASSTYPITPLARDTAPLDIPRQPGARLRVE